MRLLFDYENQQKQSTYLPKCDVERTELSLKRKQKLHLPVLCEMPWQVLAVLVKFIRCRILKVCRAVWN